jgi:hypothetical protein
MQKAVEQPRRRGRPPSENPFSELLQVRTTPEMIRRLDSIAAKRLDCPPVSQMVREAVAEFIEKQERALGNAP